MSAIGWQHDLVGGSPPVAITGLAHPTFNPNGTVWEKVLTPDGITDIPKNCAKKLDKKQKRATIKGPEMTPSGLPDGEPSDGHATGSLVLRPLPSPQPV